MPRSYPTLTLDDAKRMLAAAEMKAESCGIAYIARTLSPRAALIVGARVSGLGMALLILAVNLRDLLIYLLATAAAGGAYSPVLSSRRSTTKKSSCVKMASANR
jgi:hypothetical protein